MNARSAKLSQRSFTITEVSAVAAVLGARDEALQRAGRVDDVGVGEQQIASAPLASASATPCFCAHTLPVQPDGSGWPSAP